MLSPGRQPLKEQGSSAKLSMCGPYQSDLFTPFPGGGVSDRGARVGGEAGLVAVVEFTLHGTLTRELGGLINIG